MFLISYYYITDFFIKKFLVVMKMADEKKRLCESCGRFDKPGNLEQATELLLQDFLNNNPDSNELVVRGNCSTYWVNCLQNLIRTKGLSIRLKTAVDEESYNIEDYCNLSQ